MQPAEIFSKAFFDIFVLMGGCGSMLCLVAGILIAGRNKAKNNFPIIFFFFNINELMVFGVPIVLNPIL